MKLKLLNQLGIDSLVAFVFDPAIIECLTYAVPDREPLTLYLVY
uniref:Uncharacterized protein n=1 Tax=Picea glauca TaxID=3330 RepID=A0A124GN86_PICGL|nr:hypothetical protein ABT39_MTgene5032 [Picea glauca]QHR91985.1 hypothetical protein Q903MT_gene6021 [Picea sitchensis]